jgi:hypothetical protein
VQGTGPWEKDRQTAGYTTRNTFVSRSGSRMFGVSTSPLCGHSMNSSVLFEALEWRKFVVAQRLDSSRDIGAPESQDQCVESKTITSAQTLSHVRSSKV